MTPRVWFVVVASMCWYKCECEVSMYRCTLALGRGLGVSVVCFGCVLTGTRVGWRGLGNEWVKVIGLGFGLKD